MRLTGTDKSVAIRSMIYRLKWRIQRGYSRKDLWSLDITFASWIVPRLQGLREVKRGYPAEAETPERWDQILDEMIEGFRMLRDEGGWPIRTTPDWDVWFEDGKLMRSGDVDIEATEADMEKIQRSFDLFAEWAGALWD